MTSHRLSLNVQILIAAIFGLVGGWLTHIYAANTSWAPAVIEFMDVVGKLFVSMLKMVLMPLVFSSIVIGVANLRVHKNIGYVWKLTLGLFAFTMLVAIILSMTLMNIFEPGQGQSISMLQQAVLESPKNVLSMKDFIVNMVTHLFMNPFTAFAENQILPVIIFAMFMGVALVLRGDRYKNILHLFDEFLELMLQIIQWIMKLSPIGIFALLFKLTATQEISVLKTLGQFIAVVISATLIHGLILLPAFLWVTTKRSPIAFFKAARPALVTAFATSSSSATMPVTLKAMQTMGVRQEIAGFVIPLGSTINMDGTALYEAAAALFIANLVGMELNFAQQLIIVLTSMIAAIGAPGIPSAGMVTMIMVLQAVGLPTEAVAILLPIDRVLDTFRTAVNVEGDMVVSSIVDYKTKEA